MEQAQCAGKDQPVPGVAVEEASRTKMRVAWAAEIAERRG
jgi:hypothetical protein